MWGGNDGNDPKNETGSFPLSLPGYDLNTDSQTTSSPLSPIQLPDLTNVDVESSIYFLEISDSSNTYTLFSIYINIVIILVRSNANDATTKTKNDICE